MSMPDNMSREEYTRLVTAAERAAGFSNERYAAKQTDFVPSPDRDPVLLEIVREHYRTARKIRGTAGQKEITSARSRLRQLSTPNPAAEKALVTLWNEIVLDSI